VSGFVWNVVHTTRLSREGGHLFVTLGWFRFHSRRYATCEVEGGGLGRIWLVVVLLTMTCIGLSMNR